MAVSDQQAVDWASQIVELAKALAWPVVVLLALAVLRHPIADLVENIGRRATKISAFKVELELARLTSAKPLADQPIRRMRSAAVRDSGMVDAPMPQAQDSQTALDPVVEASRADFVLVSLGRHQEKEWFTSRLFLLAALMERSGTVRAIAFTGIDGTFVGASSPRAIRVALGRTFPYYERALAEGNYSLRSMDLLSFLQDVTAEIASHIAAGFLGSPEVSATYQPLGDEGWLSLEEADAAPAVSQAPKAAPAAPQAEEADAVSAASQAPKWERAAWVTTSLLVSLLGPALSKGSIQAPTDGKASSKLVREIARQDGAFLGLVSRSGTFEGLLEKQAILEQVAQDAIAIAEEA